MRNLTTTMATALCAVTFMVAPGVTAAAPIPQPVIDMIYAVKEDPGDLRAVVAAAKKANPDSIAEIDALVAKLGAKAEQEKVERIAALGFFEGWTGQGEAGGSISTGNSDNRGVALGLSFDKETVRWRHAIDLSVDYESWDHETTKERYFAGYAANYKFADRLYMVATVSAEKDKTAEIKSRLTEGLGLGYRIVDTATVDLGLEAGPALRQTDYYDIGRNNSVAARIAGNFTWIVTPDMVFTQIAAAHLEADHSTLETTMALTAKLMEAIAARASFEIRHETDPPAGQRKTDTATRMTLVYSF